VPSKRHHRTLPVIAGFQRVPIVDSSWAVAIVQPVATFSTSAFAKPSTLGAPR